MLELYCELLLARIGLLEAKDCDPGLEEAIKSIIYAAPRTDIKELQQARALLVEKYGKDFALVAMENKDGKVAERVEKRLRIEPPEQTLVTLYLTEIARTYGVPWPKKEVLTDRQNEADNDDNDTPGGGQGLKLLEEPLNTEGLSQATPPRDLGPRSPIRIAPPSPSTDNRNPGIKLPGSPEVQRSDKIIAPKRQTQPAATPSNVSREDQGSKGNFVSDKIPDADELAKRFAALKK